MDTSSVIAEIDIEIARLQTARALLTGSTSTKATKVKAAKAAKAPKKKRTMSAAGRKRIADAQKARWATIRKVKSIAANKLTKKTAPAKKKVAAKKAVPVKATAPVAA